MSEPSGVEGVGAPQYSQKQIREYQQRYQKGFELFQKAFKGYSAPETTSHQKTQFQKVMSEALQVMNETASLALKKDKLSDEQRLKEHYAAFLENPGPENQQKISNDINALKN